MTATPAVLMDLLASSYLGISDAMELIGFLYESALALGEGLPYLPWRLEDRTCQMSSYVLAV